MTVGAREVQEAMDSVKEARDVLNARMESLLEVVARVPLPEEPSRFVCRVPSCGIARPTAAMLDDHMANVHGVEAASVHAETVPAPAREGARGAGTS